LNTQAAKKIQAQGLKGDAAALFSKKKIKYWTWGLVRKKYQGKTMKG